jgi:hypothetical protein
VFTANVARTIATIAGEIVATIVLDWLLGESPKPKTRFP